MQNGDRIARHDDGALGEFLSPEERRRLDAIRRELAEEFETETVAEERPPASERRRARGGAEPWRQRPRVDAERGEHLRARAIADAERRHRRAGVERPARRARRRARRLVLGAAFLAGATVGVTVGALATLMVQVSIDLPAAWTFLTGPRGEDAAFPAAAAPRPAPDDLLRTLREWADATRRHDVDAQMAFYPPRVPRYGRWLDVTRADVRGDKQRAIDRTWIATMEVERPDVSLDADGRAAVTTFRVRYEDPQARRRRDAWRELRWVRTVDGWKIVGERDLDAGSTNRS